MNYDRYRVGEGAGREADSIITSLCCVGSTLREDTATSAVYVKVPAFFAYSICSGYSVLDAAVLRQHSFSRR
jgi:hypothetical protein